MQQNFDFIDQNVKFREMVRFFSIEIQYGIKHYLQENVMELIHNLST